VAAALNSAHDPRRVTFGVAIAFAVAFAVTVALGFLLGLGWSSDGSTAFDSDVTRWFVDHRVPTWTDAMRVVTWLGSSAVVFPLAIVVVVALLIGRRRWFALFVALAVGGASLLSVLAKDLIGRDRPPVGIRLQEAHSSSFPSGHSTQAAATYIALAVVVTVLSDSRALRAVTWTAATLTVFLVSVSRVYLGMHWATDVLGGWLLGSVWVGGLTVALAPLDTRQRSRVPGSASGCAEVGADLGAVDVDDASGREPGGI
jgi:membrane-associated phospholipid phosphatase